MTRHTSHTPFDFTLTVAGVERELTADVRYEYLPPERGMRERGSGIQIDPDYPAQIEVQEIMYAQRSIFDWFSDDQVQAIADDILESEES